jgi:hypothetical protein
MVLQKKEQKKMIDEALMAKKNVKSFLAVLFRTIECSNRARVAHMSSRPATGETNDLTRHECRTPAHQEGNQFAHFLWGAQTAHGDARCNAGTAFLGVEVGGAGVVSLAVQVIGLHLIHVSLCIRRRL